MNRHVLRLVLVTFFIQPGFVPAAEVNEFKHSPNFLAQEVQPESSSVLFGDDVLGLLIPSRVMARCECLLVWNGSSWNEDLNYKIWGALTLQSGGFYRPYNHSQKAYPIYLNQLEWKNVKQSNQFSIDFTSRHHGLISVFQLDFPHAPFVYVEMLGSKNPAVFRIETPQDTSPNLEAWLKKAELKHQSKNLVLKLTFEMYRNGSSLEPTLYAVNYVFDGDSWYAQSMR
jgi:hypothetical protein